MDSVHVKEFVVLASERHFRNTAARLGVSQTSLTRHIRGLEDDIGAELFDRDRRSVRLTPAGAAFLREAPALLDHLERAARLAYRVSIDPDQYLRLGHIGVGSGILQAALRAVQVTHPILELAVSEHTIRQGLDQLFSGNIDLLITRPPIHDESIEETWLCDDSLLLALPAGHPAAKGTDVTLDQLNNTPLIIPGPAEAPGAHIAVTALCRNNNFSPPRTHQVTDIPSLLILVGAGVGCGFVSASTTPNHHDPAIRILPLRGIRPIIPLHAAWRRSDTRPVLIDLREALAKAAAS
jgi:DNA-binding transcriptional LysR family regulator